jgi:hypothetical protein
VRATVVLSCGVAPAPSRASPPALGAREDAAIERLAALDEGPLAAALAEQGAELVHAGDGQAREHAGVRRAQGHEPFADENALALRGVTTERLADLAGCHGTTIRPLPGVGQVFVKEG